MAKEKFERSKPHAGLGGLGYPPLGETILINGMPFEQEDVLAMPGGSAIWKEGQAVNAGLKARQTIRDKIRKKVADPESIQGTIADGAQLCVAALLVEITALDGSNDFAEYKAMKLALLARLAGHDPDAGKGVDIVEIAQGELDKIASGETLLTAGLKGVRAVVREIMSRSTKVVAIIAGKAA